MLAAKVRRCQAAALTQEIGKRFPRLDLVNDLGAIQLDGDGLHRLRISRTARKMVDVCRRIR